MSSSHGLNCAGRCRHVVNCRRLEQPRDGAA
ncbi:hypothetical protein Ga0451573_004017, partial [Peptococcaceae bacterium DYL19]|nr:hypothetical protein [Phosphitispora fastidiosa]